MGGPQEMMPEENLPALYAKKIINEAVSGKMKMPPVPCYGHIDAREVLPAVIKESVKHPGMEAEAVDFAFREISSAAAEFPSTACDIAESVLKSMPYIPEMRDRAFDRCADLLADLVVNEKRPSDKRLNNNDSGARKSAANTLIGIMAGFMGKDRAAFSNVSGTIETKRGRAILIVAPPYEKTDSTNFALVQLKASTGTPFKKSTDPHYKVKYTDIISGEFRSNAATISFCKENGPKYEDPLSTHCNAFIQHVEQTVSLLKLRPEKIREIKPLNLALYKAALSAPGNLKNSTASPNALTNHL